MYTLYDFARPPFFLTIIVQFKFVDHNSSPKMDPLRNLGPEWSSEEIKIFHEGLLEFRKDFTQVRYFEAIFQCIYS